MKKHLPFTIFAILMSAICANAQVTSSPTPLQEDSQDVIIYFHADEGSKALMDLSPSTQLYAHTGCNLSNGETWVSSPSWGDNSGKYRLQYVSENLWSLYIGDIKTYYGISNPDVNVTGLNFVFRTAGKDKQTEDLFIAVMDDGLQVSLEGIKGEIITPSTASVTLKVNCTLAADLTLSVNGKEIGRQKGTRQLSVPYTFPSKGDYTIVASASAEGETVRREYSYCYVEDSKSAAYPGGNIKMGTVWNTDGSVTFCIGAPLKKSVILVGGWNDYKITNEQVMDYTVIDDERYFWITIRGLDYNKMYGYYFLVDGTYKVGDPYARLVLDPWNDKYLDTGAFTGLPEYPFTKVQEVPLAILHGSINDYNWQVKEFVGVAPQDLIIYELLFRDFTGTEGKAEGNGTVRQAITKIPYLVSLGVNAIEVLPIMEFNGNNSWGYNPNFYFAVDKAYGTPDDYKEFIDTCHQNGIAVILDMVFNQSDGQHPWYQMYGGIENSPFYNYGYNGENGAPHAYSVLNDWNQDFPMVQKQWHDVIRYWLTEYKFDGFRFDLVKGLGNNNSYANSSEAATNAYNQSRIDRMVDLQKVVREVNPNAYFINENLATAQEENAMAQYGQLSWANVNNAGCQFAMGYASDSDLNRMYAPKDGNRLWGSTVSYLESHDEQRLAYKQEQWGVERYVKGNVENSMRRLGSAAAQMLMTPGAHMIWQFSELGNAENTKNSFGGNNTDPKKVEWNLLNEPNHYGLYKSYSEMISIRNANPELFAQDAYFFGNCGSAVWASGRILVSKANGKELYTIVNPNYDKDITVKVDFEGSDQSAYMIASKSYGSEPSFSISAGTVTLPANCYVVIASNNVASSESIKADNSKSFRAYVSDGAIIIDYAQSQVSIYSLDGCIMNTGASGDRINLPAGIYILRSLNDTLKLMVR